MVNMPFSHFALTDPVAAQQVVQMAQLAQQEEAEKQRARVGMLSAITQGGVARDNATQQRAYSQSQMAQRDRELAQQNSQFTTTNDRLNRQMEANKALTEADIAARKTEIGSLREDEIFQALQNQIMGDRNNPGDPPTDLEFVAKTEGLPPHRRQILDDIRQRKIALLNQQADMADNRAKAWQMNLDALPLEKALERKTILDKFNTSKDRSYLELDPASNTFRSLLRRPRTDAIPGPEPIPPAVTPIEEILRNTPAAPPQAGFPGSNSLMDAYRTIAPSWLGGRPNPMMPTVQEPVQPSVPVFPPGGYMPPFVR